MLLEGRPWFLASHAGVNAYHSKKQLYISYVANAHSAAMGKNSHKVDYNCNQSTMQKSVSGKRNYFHFYRQCTGRGLGSGLRRVCCWFKKCLSDHMSERQQNMQRIGVAIYNTVDSPVQCNNYMSKPLLSSSI